MNKETLIKEFSEALQNNQGVFFIGAGISKPFGFNDWFELLKTMEDDIGISIEPTDDLTEIAQYILNKNMGNKGRLIKKIEENFNKPISNKINNYHKYLSHTKFKTIWTTNYDTTLEKNIHQHVSVRRCDDDLLPGYNSNSEIEIIKMHGCIESPSPENIVITKEDYEDYEINHPLTLERLRNELINKSFLFIGYSYRDPNIQNVMNEVRHLCNKKTRIHYMVIEEEKDSRLKKLQKLWCNDLLRYGIQSYLYKNGEYFELEDILEKISIKSKGNTIYITGSHEAENSIASELGKELAKIDDIILLNGQSEGIGKLVVQAFVEEGIINRKDICNRLKIYPNPYAHNTEWNNKDEFLNELKKFRTNLIKDTQVFILFDGGKGTKVEYELALEYGSIIVPVVTENYSKFMNDVLENTEVIKNIERYDSSYSNKLKQNKNINIGDIMKCIKTIMNIE